MQAPGLYLLFDLSFVNLDAGLECRRIGNLLLQSLFFSSVFVMSFGRLFVMNIASFYLIVLAQCGLSCFVSPGKSS